MEGEPVEGIPRLRAHAFQDLTQILIFTSFKTKNYPPFGGTGDFLPAPIMINESRTFGGALNRAETRTLQGGGVGA